MSIKSETIENEENTTISRRSEELSEQQYIPSTSGSGMQIITHIPHLVLHTRPGFCMVAMKVRSISIARL